MILDNINNKAIYLGISDAIKIALEYLKQLNPRELENGVHKINGTDIKYIYNVYTTKENQGDILEAHKEFVDVQYVISGRERVEYESLAGQDISKEYDEQNDYLLYKKNNPSTLILEEGMFAIFYPNDLHMPGISVEKDEEVKKIVLKVKVDKK